MIDCSHIQLTHMLLKKWSTLLEQKCIHMMCDPIHLVEDNVVCTMSMNSSDDDEFLVFIQWI